MKISAMTEVVSWNVWIIRGGERVCGDLLLGRFNDRKRAVMYGRHAQMMWWHHLMVRLFIGSLPLCPIIRVPLHCLISPYKLLQALALPSFDFCFVQVFAFCSWEDQQSGSAMAMLGDLPYDLILSILLLVASPNFRDGVFFPGMLQGFLSGICGSIL